MEPSPSTPTVIMEHLSSHAGGSGGGPSAPSPSPSSEQNKESANVLIDDSEIRRLAQIYVAACQEPSHDVRPNQQIMAILRARSVTEDECDWGASLAQGEGRGGGGEKKGNHNSAAAAASPPREGRTPAPPAAAFPAKAAPRPIGASSTSESQQQEGPTLPLIATTASSASSPIHTDATASPVRVGTKPSSAAVVAPALRLEPSPSIHSSASSMALVLNAFDFQFSLIGARGVPPLLAVCAASPHLRILRLSNNFLNNELVCKMVQVLRGHPSLQELDLSNNAISQPSGKALQGMIPVTLSLLRLELSGTLINAGLIERMEAVLRSRRQEHDAKSVRAAVEGAAAAEQERHTQHPAIVVEVPGHSSAPYENESSTAGGGGGGSGGSSVPPRSSLTPSKIPSITVTNDRAPSPSPPPPQRLRLSIVPIHESREVSPVNPSLEASPNGEGGAALHPCLSDGSEPARESEQEKNNHNNSSTSNKPKSSETSYNNVVTLPTESGLDGGAAITAATTTSSTSGPHPETASSPPPQEEVEEEGEKAPLIGEALVAPAAGLEALHIAYTVLRDRDSSPLHFTTKSNHAVALLMQSSRHIIATGAAGANGVAISSSGAASPHHHHHHHHPLYRMGSAIIEVGDGGSASPKVSNFSAESFGHKLFSSPTTATNPTVDGGGAAEATAVASPVRRSSQENVERCTSPLTTTLEVLPILLELPATDEFCPVGLLLRAAVLSGAIAVQAPVYSSLALLRSSTDVDLRDADRAAVNILLHLAFHDPMPQFEEIVFHKEIPEENNSTKNHDKDHTNPNGSCGAATSLLPELRVSDGKDSPPPHSSTTVVIGPPEVIALSSSTMSEALPNNQSTLVAAAGNNNSSISALPSSSSAQPPPQLLNQLLLSTPTAANTPSSLHGTLLASPETFSVSGNSAVVSSSLLGGVVGGGISGGNGKEVDIAKFSRPVPWEALQRVFEAVERSSSSSASASTTNASPPPSARQPITATHSSSPGGSSSTTHHQQDQSPLQLPVSSSSVGARRRSSVDQQTTPAAGVGIGGAPERGGMEGRRVRSSSLTLLEPQQPAAGTVSRVSSRHSLTQPPLVHPLPVQAILSQSLQWFQVAMPESYDGLRQLQDVCRVCAVGTVLAPAQHPSSQPSPRVVRTPSSDTKMNSSACVTGAR